MKKFNPEKELRKIQKGNKNKIIFSVIALLLIIAIGSSYALYQIRYNKQIIYTTVDNFYQNDVSLSVYIDGNKKTDPNSFPEQNSGKIFSHITCENGGTGYFDNKEWKLKLETTEQDRCNVYFVTGNLPNEPELFQGMIPVTFSDTGIMYVADTDKDWYNYQDHRWANAVLVDASNPDIKAKYFDGNNLRDDIVGIQVPMDEILQMYVWIPRYKYKLFNESNFNTPKQIIEIIFEKGTESTGDVTCTYTNNGDGTITEKCLNKQGNEASKGEWYTHPAFTFKGTTETTGTELKGIWVGKFEPSDAEDAIGRNENNIGEITILPNKTSMVSKSISTAFFAEQKISNELATKYNLKTNEVDTRIMKNIEWGAVAYLTQSIYGIYTNDGEDCVIEDMDKDNCEVWVNNTAQGTGESGDYVYGGTYTGCVGDSVSANGIWNTDGTQPAQCKETNRWNTGGIKASTTGNMYGIYDMSGGTYEFVMGVIVEDGGRNPYYVSDHDGFNKENMPNEKYYDLYEFSESYTTRERGHLGDATKETLLNTSYEWNNDYATFPSAPSNEKGVWFTRGAYQPTSHYMAGVFSMHRHYGNANKRTSFRSVLSAA